jgi:hypothetical protein
VVFDIDIFITNAHHVIVLDGKYQHARSVAVDVEITPIDTSIYGNCEISVYAAVPSVDLSNLRQLVHGFDGELSERLLAQVQDKSIVYICH